jgi:hypothetical protein
MHKLSNKRHGDCLPSQPSSMFESVGIGDVRPLTGGKGEELIC